MNVNELSFVMFFIPHTKKWSIKVQHKGVRLSAPFLIECADNLNEAIHKLMMWVQQMVNQKPLGESVSDYVARNKSGE